MVRLKTDEEWGEIWNEEFKKRLKENKPYPYVNEKMADYLEQLLLKAKEVYYNTGEPIMSDSRYDRFEENLRLLRSNSEVLKQVGYKIKG